MMIDDNGEEKRWWLMTMDKGERMTMMVEMYGWQGRWQIYNNDDNNGQWTTAAWMNDKVGYIEQTTNIHC